MTDKVKAMLEFLTKYVPHDGVMLPEDVQRLRDAGLSDEAIKEALEVAWCFTNLSKLADALDWPLGGDESQQKQGRMLHRKGYMGSSLPDYF